MFQLGRSYKTRGGWRAEIIDLDSNGCLQTSHSLSTGTLVVWHNANGERAMKKDTAFDLTTEEWKAQDD